MEIKQARLTRLAKQSIIELLPTLTRFGCRIPRELHRKLNGGFVHDIKLSRKQVKAVEQGLCRHGRVVVNIMGRDRGFRVTPLHDFLAKQQQAKGFHAKSSARSAASVSKSS